MHKYHFIVYRLVHATVGQIFYVIEAVSISMFDSYIYNCSVLCLYADLYKIGRVDVTDVLSMSLSDSKISRFCFVSVCWSLQHWEKLLML